MNGNTKASSNVFSRYWRLLCTQYDDDAVLLGFQTTNKILKFESFLGYSISAPVFLNFCWRWALVSYNKNECTYPFDQCYPLVKRCQSTLLLDISIPRLSSNNTCQIKLRSLHFRYIIKNDFALFWACESKKNWLHLIGLRK